MRLFTKAGIAPAVLAAAAFMLSSFDRWQAFAAKPLDVELEDLRPGLLAQYSSLVDKDATLSRIDSRPAFTLGHSSIHPRIPAGPFAAEWTGAILIKDAGDIRFDAHLCGELAVEVDGVVVLQGQAEKETATISGKSSIARSPGVYRLKIRYRSLPDLPARLQIGWQGEAFAHEPLAAWHLKHLAAEKPAAFAHEELADKGRQAAARFGCTRCHSGAFPGVGDPPPGPSLADLDKRVSRSWLMEWLNDPGKLHAGARMPALFPATREGFVERWVIAENLLRSPPVKPIDPPGDHRYGRRLFVNLGCAACHYLPDEPIAKQPGQDRHAFHGLADRFPPADLASFLANPHGRYPDGRMPRLPLSPENARDIAAFLLLWSKPAEKLPDIEPPSPQEVHVLQRRVRAYGRDTAVALFREKGCIRCHSGLGPVGPADVKIAKIDGDRGCLSGKSGPRFNLDADTHKAINAYLAIAARDKHPSPYAGRQRLLDHLGCQRCHSRGSELPPPIETIGSTLGGAWLQDVPFQRTPRLYYPHQKYTRSYLLSAVREGVSGLRPSRYSYRMPAFGKDAETIVQALAEADGDLPAGPEPVEVKPADPTVASLSGPMLAGFQGYACVSCHIWNGRAFSEPDPGAVGTDLTRVAGRIRRDWLDRYLEAPLRFNPNTVMPAIFPHGKPATLTGILDGSPQRQKEALWAYFSLGRQAPAPKPPPPLPIAGPTPAESPLVALIPVRLPDGKLVESVCLLSDSHDLVVYDLQAGAVRAIFTGGQILVNAQGRLRGFAVAGTETKLDFPGLSAKRTFQGYDRVPGGVRLRWSVEKSTDTVAEVIRFAKSKSRVLERETQRTGGSSELIDRKLPPAQTPPPFEQSVLLDPGKIEGSLERPGYRAIAYPRPKTVSGEDRVMPSAVAADPKTGRVFVASMKTGELFAVHDPTDDGKKARFDNYARGLFEEAFSMLGEPDGLYVLHRRNLTRITDTDKDGIADRFDRIAELPHGIADTYDYAYGLARDKSGAFVISYAPHANTGLTGSGSALRLVPGKKPTEVAYGFRNPLGWCAGPEGEIFFTDNQGEWVATNKLCHLSEGRFFGFPNSAQKQHTKKPPGKTAVWVPYSWARSINGVAYNHTGDKFGPFAGQLFMAELMFGGAIIRANVEKVNGEYQGACFPFWGQGLLGPLTLTFDPKGRLWVGGITEPGWMAQPDRGALFRIDFTGKTPFEMKSIHALPRGFRIVFTKPVARATALDLKSYQIDHYRYELTGAYGSPELDRTRSPIERVEVSADGRSVDITTGPLVKDRVYMIQAAGVRSESGEGLVHATGAYTLNEIPRQ